MENTYDKVTRSLIWAILECSNVLEMVKLVQANNTSTNRVQTQTELPSWSRGATGSSSEPTAVHTGCGLHHQAVALNAPPAFGDIFKKFAENTLQGLGGAVFYRGLSSDHLFQLLDWCPAPSSVCSEFCSPGYRKAPIQGMPVCCYECVPCSDGEISNQSDSAVCIKCPGDSWPDERKVICITKIVEYLSFDDPLGASLSSLSITLSVIPAFILWTFIKYRDTPIVKANNRNLSYFLLVALILCFLCSLIFIGKPQQASCLLRQTTFGVIFAYCIALILAKTITVVIVFGTTRPEGFKKKWLGSRTPSFIGCFCAVLQLTICIIWLVYAMPFPEKNMNSFKNKIIIECNEGSLTMFYLMLGYLGLLSSVCFVVAFLVRKLPDRYNEAKFITFSMLIFVSVWLSFIPAYLSTKGKYVVAVEIFAILSSGFGLLSCIFFRKCYIILVRPDRNIKESVSWRSH
ncbi:vomeronasal type-2 receptor 26-like [Protopterus annectens]|uniref:vomeronasal type-2 receptor 26-like n=1 Tax=Protopterus annectens TaxID=7888 RepID=UPI001CFB150A|nr:vomeronasal type-2 receptor 26-like [Protopterus annectens]